MKKNILKILVIVALFVILLCNMTVFATVENINKEHWAKEIINEFVKKEYLNVEEAEKDPNQEVTKGELTKIVNCYFSYGEAESYEDNLEIAESKGYLSNSKSEEKITREEIAILFCKILSLSPLDDATSNFIDAEEISIWAKGYVNIIEKEKLIIGYPDMTYRPQKNITKAELITILNRCTGIGGNDLVLVDSEIENIEVGIFDYKDGKTKILPISENIEMKSGDEIKLALILPENINEEQIDIEIENEEIAVIDTDLYLLSALKVGEAKIIFRVKEEKFKFEFVVKVQ